MVQKGELQRFMNGVATDLGINWQYQSYRFRVEQMPKLAVTTTALEEGAEEEDKDDNHHVEPFLKFIKEETG
jgi:hypothetical protein